MHEARGVDVSPHYVAVVVQAKRLRGGRPGEVKGLEYVVLQEEAVSFPCVIDKESANVAAVVDARGLIAKWNRELRERMLAELDRITMTLHSGVHEVASADAMFVQTEKLVERRVGKSTVVKLP